MSNTDRSEGREDTKRDRSEGREDTKRKGWGRPIYYQSQAGMEAGASKTGVESTKDNIMSKTLFIIQLDLLQP